MNMKRLSMFILLVILIITACGEGAPSEVVLPVITSENSGSLTNISAEKIIWKGEMRWLSDGSSIATVGDREISIIGKQTLQEEQHFTSPSTLYQTLAISPKGDRVAIIVDEFTKVEIWNIEPPKLEMTLGDDEEFVHVNIATFSPDGISLATGGWGEDCAMVILWDLQTGNVIEKIALDEVKPAFNRAIYNLDFSPDGKGWAAIACDGSLHIHYSNWSYYEPGDDAVAHGAALAFSPNGDLLAVGGHPFSDNLCIYDISTTWPEIIFDLKEPKGDVSDVSFNADSTLVAAIVNRYVNLWNIKTGEHLIELDTYPVDRVSFSPDGILLATAGMRDGLGIWAVAEP